MTKAPMCECLHVKFGYALKGSVLTKKAKASKHHVRVPGGWAVQESVINFHKASVTDIEILDTESGALWRSSMKNFLEYARRIERGGGQQLLLLDHRWTVQRVGEGAQIAMF